MVPLANNSYDLREYLLKQITGSLSPLENAFLLFLNMNHSYDNKQEKNALPQYERCAIQGFRKETADSKEMARLLGTASVIDGSPMPWVTNIWALLGIHIAAKNSDDTTTISKFTEWVDKFLPNTITSKNVSSLERSIAEYMLGRPPSDNLATLFLHYTNLAPISDPAIKLDKSTAFLGSFKKVYQRSFSATEAAIYVFVFDSINNESAAVPPNYWNNDNLLCFLENIPVGFRRWTWEEIPKTKKSPTVKWIVANEYHVQNLLYVMLAPIFPDIKDEINVEHVGQKNPRVDLYLPSINTLIEVKYRKDNKKSFQDLIGEIGQDFALYKSDTRFKNATFTTFLWDNTRATEEHTLFKEGILKMGVDGCVVASSPSMMVSSEDTD